MEKTNIQNKVIEIDNENNISLKYEHITKLHDMINKEELKLEKFSEKLEKQCETKYDDMELEQIIKKFEKTDNIDKKIKYYHSISNQIDSIINSISN
jgi:hypothetical protein